MKSIYKKIMFASLPILSLLPCATFVSCSNSVNDFKGRDAFIMTADGQRHWFSSLTSSNICSDVGADIIDDSGQTFVRNEFNYELFINPNIKNIPDNFLMGCTALEDNIYFEWCDSVKTIGKNFLCGCKKVECGAIDLPSSLEEIGDNFLQNIPLVIGDLNLSNCSNLKKIGKNFLRESGYDDIIDFTSCQNLELIGNGFLYCTDNVISVNISHLKQTIFEEDDPTNDFISFATKNAQAQSIVSGVGIKGDNAQLLMDRFPNSIVTPFRNLKIIL